MKQKYRDLTYTIIAVLVALGLFCAFLGWLEFTTPVRAQEGAMGVISKPVIFTGKLHRNLPYVAAESGAVQEIKNMVRPTPGMPVGWKCRKGTELFNSSAFGSGSQVKSLYQYVNHDFDTSFFIAQCNDQIYTAGAEPPSTYTDFAISGNPAYTLSASTTYPAFHAHVNDDYVGAVEGSTSDVSPWAWSGGKAYPDGFKVRHSSSNLYDDGWEIVRNTDTNSTLAVPDGSDYTNECILVGFRRKLDGIYLYLSGTANVVTSAMTVYAWQSGAWASVTGLSDGTSATNCTLGQSGFISWTYDDDDDPYLLPNTKDHLFWYKITWSADLTDDGTIYGAYVTDKCDEIVDLSSGLYEIALGALEYSSSTGHYQDWTGEVTDGTDADYAELDDMPASNYFYVGFGLPALGIRLAMVADHTNTSDSLDLTISYWDASAESWTNISGVTDGTSDGTRALAQTGVIYWDGESFYEDKRQLGGIMADLYWYRLQWSAALPSDIQIWEVSELVLPKNIPNFPYYHGVIEYNQRALWWPARRWKNGVDFSQEGLPHILNGPRAGTSGGMFGPGTVNAVAMISSYGIVSTKDPYRLYLLEGKVVGRFDELLISKTVGVVAPHSLVVIEDAVKLFSATRKVHAAIFLAPDGFYMCDGQTVVHISDPVSDYFDKTDAPYIEPDYMDDCYAWVDHSQKLVLFAVPINTTATGTQTTLNKVMPYNYLTDEWYDTFDYNQDLSCGVELIGSDNQRLTYGGDYAGHVYRLNYGSADDNTSGTDQVIEHYVKTTDIIPLSGVEGISPLNYESTLLSVKVKGKSDSTGDLELKVYPDGATTAVNPSPASSSSYTCTQANSGYDYFSHRFLSGRTAETFAFRLRSGASSGEVDTQSEWYGITMDSVPERESQ